MKNLIFEKDTVKAIIIAIWCAVIFVVCYTIMDYVNFFNDYNSSVTRIIYNKQKLNNLIPVVMIPTIAFIALSLVIFMPSDSKKWSQKLVLNGTKIVILFVTYITIMIITKNTTYLEAKRENFLNNISVFYSQYSETDDTKELISYLNQNDYKAINNMNNKKLQYTDALVMTNIVNQINNITIKKIYNESIKDGHINLSEKEKLDTLILKAII